MFSSRDLSQLQNVPIDQQVVKLLTAAGEPMHCKDIQERLLPKPTANCICTLLARLVTKSVIAAVNPDARPESRSYGLPGWALRPAKPEEPPEPVAAAASAPQTDPSTEESPMTKKAEKAKKATRAKPGEHDARVIEFINQAADPVTRGDIAQALQLDPDGGLGSILKRLKGAGVISSIGKAGATKWIPAKSGAAATTPKPVNKREAPARKSNGTDPKFGYFNDGSLSIDCETCKGVLTLEQLNALLAFTNQVGGQR